MAQLDPESNFWWSRLRNETLLATLDGPLSLAELAFTGTKTKANRRRLELEVLLGEPPLPARLLLERVPAAVAAKRRAPVKTRGRNQGPAPGPAPSCQSLA
ncbi:MAG: hypothetical protein BWK78_07875 [Thiotrichaceae bacterium IS1]|nr:MAG: hypothetical protein BWK78_07875 [Thiotrichaceae bacterium IS1]